MIAFIWLNANTSFVFNRHRINQRFLPVKNNSKSYVSPSAPDKKKLTCRVCRVVKKPNFETQSSHYNSVPRLITFL